MVRLGDVCDFVYGFPFNSNFFNDEGDGKPLIRIRDVVPGVTNTFTTEPAPSKYDVSDGDLLVGMDGDFNLAQWAGGPALLNQRVCMFKPKPDALSVGFLKHSLGKYLKAIWDKKPFATVKHLSAKDLNAIFLPLPSLPVQREIVTRLERELAEADSLAANFKRIAELADAEFKAELDETFMQLGGKTVRLEDKCKISYGYTGEAVSGPQGDLPKYLRITDIQNNTVEWERVPACKCPNFEKFRLLQGDIVFARTGATTGKSYLLQGDFPRAVYASYLIRLRIQDTSIDPYFLKYYFGTSKYWEAIESGMAGAAQGGFNSTKLGALTVAIPSRDEQRKTVAQLNAASEQCEKLKTAAMYGATRAAALRAATLTEAFAP